METPALPGYNKSLNTGWAQSYIKTLFPVLLRCSQHILITGGWLVSWAEMRDGRGTCSAHVQQKLIAHSPYGLVPVPSWSCLQWNSHHFKMWVLYFLSTRHEWRVDCLNVYRALGFIVGREQGRHGKLPYTQPDHWVYLAQSALTGRSSSGFLTGSLSQPHLEMLGI